LTGGDPGANRWAGRAPRELDNANFRARAGTLERMEGQDFYSLLNIAADKKEIRRLEQKAVEAARDFLRKAA
ncbi:hypothetical protein NL491_28220, partial [Klebsiella pneumoniae]|nr:hypothetical protein [Klebsiella pneumoniae]